jgi:hypothetical protein
MHNVRRVLAEHKLALLEYSEISKKTLRSKIPWGELAKWGCYQSNRADGLKAAAYFPRWKFRN